MGTEPESHGRNEQNQRSHRDHRDDLGPLVALLVEPSTSALITDFDGTLAPIVPEPSKARPFPGVPALLEELSRSLGVVAVVSGRPALFLARHFGRSAPGVRLVGLYGLESFEAGSVRRSPEVDAWCSAVAEVAGAGTDVPPGVELEDKGPSLTVHWRNSRDPRAAAEWAEEFVALWSQRTGLLVQRGRLALELRPPIEVDKGTVTEAIAREARAVCFAGDDAGDLAAFAALDDLAQKGATAVRIAVMDEESPPRLAASADLVLSRPEELFALLTRLAEALGQSPAASS